MHNYQTELVLDSGLFALESPFSLLDVQLLTQVAFLLKHTFLLSPIAQVGVSSSSLYPHRILHNALVVGEVLFKLGQLRIVCDETFAVFNVAHVIFSDLDLSVKLL